MPVVLIFSRNVETCRLPHASQLKSGGKSGIVHAGLELEFTQKWQNPAK